MSFGCMLNAQPSGFIHITQIGDDTLSRSSLGADRFDDCPIIVALAVLIDGELPEKRAQRFNIAMTFRKRENTLNCLKRRNWARSNEELTKKDAIISFSYEWT